MYKFKITSDRFHESCSILDNHLIINGKHIQTATRILPRFLTNGNGEYVMKITLDEDGDPVYENENAAAALMLQITPKRLEKLALELVEAAKTIVNPPSAGA